MDTQFTNYWPLTLAKRNADSIRGRMHIRVMVGEQDHLVKENKEFHELLDSLNIKHKFQIVEGIGHTKWEYYDLLGFSTFPFYLMAFSGVEDLPSTSVMSEVWGRIKATFNK